MFDHHLLVEGSPGLPGNGAGQTVPGASRNDSDRNLRGDLPVLSIKEAVVDLVQESVTRHDDDGSPSPDVLLRHQLPSRRTNIIIESELIIVFQAQTCHSFSWVSVSSHSPPQTPSVSASPASQTSTGLFLSLTWGSPGTGSACWGGGGCWC